MNASAPSAASAAVSPVPQRSPTPAAAVLLVNTGTPEQPDNGAVARFLRRFLSDPRVIELPRLLWLPLLYGLVVPWRAPRSARKYRGIWQPDGSPLLIHTSRLRAAIERELHARGNALRVEQAFLYSPPLVSDAVEILRLAGVRRLLVLPLYPQSSGSTTGATYDQVARALRRWRSLPELRYIAGYGGESDYIAALAASVAETGASRTGASHLLVSFHGLPQAYVDAGDRYAQECRHTAEQLAQALKLAPQDWSLSFQSRFGANRWLTPATAATLAELPRRGVRAVTVICPGFAADCLETLEEIADSGRKIFFGAGGESFQYVPALNSGAAHARTLTRLIERHSADWDSA